MTSRLLRPAVVGPTHRRLAALLLLAPAASACRPARPASADPAPAAAVVYVVRHAEKAPVPGDDPPLSVAGEARAAALAMRLAGARVQTVLVTPRQRTAQTAAPLAAARGLTPASIPFGTSTDGHVRAVASAATAALQRHPGGAVLVVGHSNTVAAIVGALGAPRPADLCDAAYATLFVVRPATAAAPATVTRASYGAPDPAEAATCAAPVAR